jgi:cytoskeletal protein RodZ
VASINIGETLRKARIDKKISLDELQQRTKIQKRYLLAIEENDFHELPSDYYLRTFIRQYADEVKLDGNYLIDVLDGKDRPMPTYPELETVDGLRKNKHVESPTRARFKATLPMILLGLVALAIISVVGYMTWLDHQETAIIVPFKLNAQMSHYPWQKKFHLHNRNQWNPQKSQKNQKWPSRWKIIRRTRRR